MANKLFVLLDGRAYVDVDKAHTMDTAYSEDEARAVGNGIWKGHSALWYEYDVKKANDGVTEELHNGKPRPDIPPGTNLPEDDLRILKEFYGVTK